MFGKQFSIHLTGKGAEGWERQSLGGEQRTTWEGAYLTTFLNLLITNISLQGTHSHLPKVLCPSFERLKVSSVVFWITGTVYQDSEHFVTLPREVKVCVLCWLSYSLCSLLLSKMPWFG